jgi:hypothetical protein
MPRPDRFTGVIAPLIPPQSELQASFFRCLESILNGAIERWRIIPQTAG